MKGQSPDFVSVAAELLAKLGDRELDPQERNNPEQLAKRLLQKLQSHPYWIQMDSLERLLKPEQPTNFIDLYWATFLQRCLTDSNIVSRLVLTAQAFPMTLVEFSDRYPNAWAEIRLDGLLQVEQQLEFFTKRGVIVEPSNRDILTRIAQIYEGHPLVLKVIAEDILNSFAGDVTAYWQVYQPEFEKVARELQATRLDETEYNEALDRKVRERIKRSLEQLSTNAFDLLCRSAVFRRPVPKKFWLAMIGDRSSKDQKAAYRVLDDHALIEKESTDIRQHNLIRDVAYDLLCQNSCIWETAERQAAHLWLTDYKPAPDAPKLETVRGYLEAFAHYCQVEDWESARDILETPLNTSKESQLHWQLGIWGLYKEQIELCQRILNKLDIETDRIWLNTLGIAFRNLNKYQQAITYHERYLDISRKVLDMKGELVALNNLGTIYDYLSDFSKAITLREQTLEISRQLKDRHSEGNSLCNLGIGHFRIGKFEQAIDELQQSLIIAREVGDLQLEGNVLGNLGFICDRQGNYQEAVDYFEQCLKIMGEIENIKGQGSMLGNLGSAYIGLGEFEKAIGYIERRLVIAREMKDRYGEATALGNLGVAYNHLHDYSKAMKYNKEHLSIAREIKDSSGEARALSNLGSVYNGLEDHKEAIIYHQQHLDITRRIKDSYSESVALLNLGATQMKLEQYKDAQENMLAALDLSRKIPSQYVEANTLKSFAELYQAMGELKEARQYCQQAQVMATALGIPLAAECEALLQQIDGED